MDNEDIEVLKYFSDSKKGFYVDIGCYHPTFHNNTYLLNKKGWKGINVDVSKFSIDLFNYLRPKDLNYNFAVSDENKMLRLFFQKEFSVLNTTNKNQALKAFQGKIQKKNIQAFTLDKILSKGKYKNKRIDFLNIDVEGADLNVLKGLSFNIYKPELICVEIHDRQVKNSDVYKFLSLKNYKLMWSGVFSHLFRTKSSLL